VANRLDPFDATDCTAAAELEDAGMAHSWPSPMARHEAGRVIGMLEEG
jgi:hypothetical protein